MRYLKRLRKDVNICKNECKWLYNQIKSKLGSINVYGMSSGDVDIPYLKQLREKWPKAFWQFSYYSMNDNARAIQIAKNILKLEYDKYNTFEFINPVGEQIKQELIQEQGIVEYSRV